MEWVLTSLHSSIRLWWWLWLGTFLSFTCCLAYPTAYRRSYNYFPPMISDLTASGANSWDIAQEPLTYEQPEPDYYSEPQWTDMEALSNLIDLYDNAPVWGQILNERPEMELEELKHHSGTDKRGGGKGSVSSTTPTSIGGQAHGSTSTAIPPTTTTKVPIPAVQKVSVSGQHHQGQKEFPLLRPPNKPKTVEALPVITQRSLGTERKASPYDTLRQYLSIEDAWKKEVEKRRSSNFHNEEDHFTASGHGHEGLTRQVKRSYVADEDSLMGQLSNLKNSVN